MTENGVGDEGKGRNQSIEEPLKVQVNEGKDHTEESARKRGKDDKDITPQGNLQETPKRARQEKRSSSTSRSRSKARKAHAMRSRSASKGRKSKAYGSKASRRQTQEDDENTIGSNETTFNLTREEADEEIPPAFVRYRFGLQLDKVNLALIDLAQGNQDALTPANRCRTIIL